MEQAIVLGISTKEARVE
uniref:Uncharacterized protein n=1 Tax=Arundo donax TaxID=35708 RepID=A0A0A9AAJ7_ARUDO